MELSGVLNYFRSSKGNVLSTETGIILPIPNKTVIKEYAKAIIERLNSVDNEILEDVEIMLSEFSAKRQSDNRTCKEKLKEKIEKKHD